MTTYTQINNQHHPYLPFGDKQDAPFYNQHILSVKQFNRADLEYIFGVAHEMTRRGYLVSFTMGNATAIDLLCRSPKGQDFSLQVKTLKAKGWFIFQEEMLSQKMSVNGETL